MCHPLLAYTFEISLCHKVNEDPKVANDINPSQMLFSIKLLEMIPHSPKPQSNNTNYAWSVCLVKLTMGGTFINLQLYIR